MRLSSLNRQYRWFLRLSFFPAFLAALWCVNIVAAPQDDTLRLLFWQAPTQLNPHLTGGFKDLGAARITYEPLASFDREGNLVPFLAAEIPTLGNGGVAPDGMSVTWKLKPDIKWSDGQPFTADDVVFTYQFASHPETKSVTAVEYKIIDHIEVIDDLTLTIHFTQVTPDWASVFVGRSGMILPRHVFEEYANASVPDAPANRMPVGTGPYRVIEYATEDMLIIGEDVVNTMKIVYEINPFFREADACYFQRIELRGGGDALTAAQAVLTDGSVDFAWNLQVEPDTLQTLANSPKGQLMPLPGALIERILLNATDPNRATETGERSSIAFPHPFFSDKRVRRAFAHAIDRTAVARLYGETASATTNILVAPSMYNSPNTAERYPFDLARAASLLDEAGWIDNNGDGVREKDGVNLRVLFQTSVNALRQQTQELIKASLASIGVEVELKVIDASIFFSADPNNTNTGRHFYADMQEYFIGNRFPDPGAYMDAWRCDQILQQANNWAGGGNVARWCRADYDDLSDQVATEIDPLIRARLFIRMNDLLIEDVAAIPLVNIVEINGVSHTLDGVTLTPWDSVTWQIAAWRRNE